MLAVNTTVPLAALRVLMANLSLSALIVPLQDSHQGTRTPACSARLPFISGFTGSSGTALVTEKAALLWTDGRYFTQAMDELDNNWTLMREGILDTPTMEQYLAKELKSGAKIGVDPSLFSKTAWNSMESKLKQAGQTLNGTPTNLIDDVWGDKRPECPKEPLVKIPSNYTGKTSAEKLEALRIIMNDRRVDGVVLNQLDDIAWLLNLRGFDIPSAALFLAFAIVKNAGYEFFIDNSKLSEEIRNEIVRDGGEIFSYNDVNERLSKLITSTSGKIWLDKTCSYSLVSLVPENRQHIELSPVIPMKAVKNSVEIQGVKNALIRDAAILARFYAWLENEVTSGRNVTELSASDKLMEMRKENDMFLTTSFTSIIGCDSNGAIIHYRPTEQTNKAINKTSMVLIDAGAAYKDGTTDITRTFHFGTPSDHQKECYTRVLKGQIAVAKAVFPTYTRGNRLDSFARKYLWDIGLDYNHGTGHGIGINVHEGPSRITYDFNLAPDDMGLRENMLSSNEPGYYEEGKFGIRLENIVRIVNSTAAIVQKPFSAVEDMTFLPYEHNLIQKELLTQAEIDYLNQYQEKCRSIVGEYVKTHYPTDPANDWIIRKTPKF